MVQAFKAIFVISLLAGLTWWVVTAMPPPDQIGASKQPLVTQTRQNTLKREVRISNPANNIDNTSVTLASTMPLTFTPAYTTYLPIIARNYCPPLYTDNFSDPGSGWLIGDSGDSLREYLNGEFHILIRSVNWFTGSRSGFKASDYIVAVDVRNATGVYGSYGLIFGVSDPWTQFYTFEIFPDGVYEIWRYNFGTWTRLTSGSSGSINPGTATNRVKIERNGALIKAYANGQLLTSISDSTSTGLKQVGVGASTSNQPNLDVRFDNFVVYPLTCGPAATVLSGASETPSQGGMETGLPNNKSSGSVHKSK